MNEPILSAANRNRIRRSAARCLLGIIGVTALTFVCFRLHLNISTTGFLYLIVIVFLSLAGDFAASVVTALLAGFCLMYFFAPPIFSIRVDDPLNIVAIIAFLTTSLVISRLVTEVREKSEHIVSSVNRKLVEAELRESNRIARELHDDVGQRLALLSVGLGELQHRLPNSDPEIGICMDNLQQQTKEIATDVQAISHQLHSSKLEYLSIAAAMQGFCREFSERQKVEVDFKSMDLTTRLTPEVSLGLYRVLQEALQNAVRNSGTRRFEVELFGASGAVHLAVRDSGVGFDPEVAISGRGLGLTSMQERMKLIKGKFLIESQPGMGTTINAWVPLDNQRSEHLPQRKAS